MDPANDYVERFVEDVDLSKVLTAGHIMKRAESVTPDKGPRVALQMMRDQGISTIYVMDKKRMLLGYVTAKMLLGYVTANQASDAIKEKKSIEEVMTKDVPTVSKDTFLNDLFESMFSANVPLAVVDDQGRLQGIVVKGAVMGAMAGNEDVINGNGVIS